MKFLFINNFIYFLFIFLFFFGCSKDYSHLSIIEENDLNNNLNNMYEEVFLNHSTVLFTPSIDSKNNNSTLFIGKYEDNFFGSLISKSFLNFFFNKNIIPNIFNFHSVNMSLKINYFYGFNFSRIQVFRLYKFSKFENLIKKNTSENLIGIIKVDFSNLKYRKSGVVIIDINNIINNNCKNINNNVENFFNNNDGISIIPEHDNTLVFGIDLDSINTKFIFYYKEYDVDKVYNFIIGDLFKSNLFSYYKLFINRSKSNLNNLIRVSKNYKLNSIYVQNITGLATKINFKNFIKFFKRNKKIKISKIELSIDFNGKILKKRNLFLFIINNNILHFKGNRIINEIVNFSNENKVINIKIIKIKKNCKKLSIPLTNYINSIYSNSMENNFGLIIGDLSMLFYNYNNTLINSFNFFEKSIIKLKI